MHFHLPKPLHGWREFAGEVGIIVVGVLIALGAEQIAETWHWHEQVGAGREELRQNYVAILALAGEREAKDQCIRSRLIFLRNILDAHADTLPPIGHVGSPPARDWYPASWDSLVASNVSAHMTRIDLLAFGTIAQQARGAENTANQEIEDWSTIYTMVGPARRLETGEAVQLRRVITDAAYQLNMMRLIAPQISDLILKTNLISEGDRREAAKQVAQTLRAQMHVTSADRLCLLIQCA